LLILLLDDDLLMPEAFQSLFNCLEQYPVIDVVFGKRYLKVTGKSLLAMADAAYIRLCADVTLIYLSK
jgi:hypothetical protein